MLLTSVFLASFTFFWVCIIFATIAQKAHSQDVFKFFIYVNVPNLFLLVLSFFGMLVEIFLKVTG